MEEIKKLIKEWNKTGMHNFMYPFEKSDLYDQITEMDILIDKIKKIVSG